MEMKTRPKKTISSHLHNRKLILSQRQKAIETHRQKTVLNNGCQGVPTVVRVERR